LNPKSKDMNLNSLFTSRVVVVLVLIALAALSRLIPHEYNFTPIGAIALFAGTYITSKRLAFLLPLVTLFISDILLEITSGTGFYRDMIFVYFSIALVVAIGFLLRGREQRQTIMVASLVSSMVFFFITNFGVFLMHDLYPKTGAGLISCYIAGIPFLKGTLMGDLFYNLVLFGSFALIRWQFPRLVESAAPASN
jgi:membrane-associated HD superfamily phosphohydrolase